MDWRSTLRTTVDEVRARRRQNRELAARNPGFREAVRADLQITLKYRGERAQLRDPLDTVLQAARLAVVSDAFLAQVVYRGRVALRRHGVPVLPALAHRLSMVLSDVCIGDPVLMKGGVYIPHGQVVVDGITEIGSDTILFPWTTVGLKSGNFQGPTLRDGVHLGTGSRVLGPLTLGEGAFVGANAVVVRDVAAHDVVVGVPAAPLTTQRADEAGRPVAEDATNRTRRN